jgi:hypothetical protein
MSECHVGRKVALAEVRGLHQSNYYSYTSNQQAKRYQPKHYLLRPVTGACLGWWTVLA